MKRSQYQVERLARLREAGAILAYGICPQCGTKLCRNLALAGWFQCGRYGAPGFQREAGR